MYCKIRSKFFQGRKLSKTTSEYLLEDNDTPLFLNSAGKPFQKIDLKHVKEAIGLDFNSYDFRRIISTWALSHELEEIRSAEAVALQHSDKVATDRYQQNKQVKPQTLTQKYIQQENLFSSTVESIIESTEMREKSSITENKHKMKNKRYTKLREEKEVTLKFHRDNKPLGPRKRIASTDRRLI